MEAVSNMTGKKIADNAEKRRGISGSTLKILAVAAMLIDHIGAVVLARAVIARNYSIAYWGGESQLDAWMAQNGALFYAYEIMRGIGRLGFPVFCFLLAEGFQRTRSVGKYALRLGIFAVVSEIPFNLALAGDIYEPEYQNVYFTLLLGLLVLWSWDFVEKHKKMPGVAGAVFMVTGAVFSGIYFGIWLGIRFLSDNRGEMIDYLTWRRDIPAQYGIVCAVVCAVMAIFLFWGGRKKGMEWAGSIGADMTALITAMCLAEFLRTDYAGMGVLTIAVIYVLRKRPKAAMAAGCAVLTIMSASEIFAFFAVIFIAWYNGKRGLKMKYFFYAFYPVHLFLLYLLVLALGLGNIRLM